MNEFMRRNALRKRQLEYANTSWVRQVGDRVQLTRDYGGHGAWECGVIVAITQELWTIGLSGVECPTVTFQMENGDRLKDDNQRYGCGLAAPIVPHESYFAEEDALPEAALVEAQT